MNEKLLDGRTVAILVSNGFDEVEYVYYRDREKYIYTSWTNIESLPIDNDSYDYSSKEAYWLVRKENNFSKTDIDVDPRDCLFLFKLNEEIQTTLQS